MAKKSAGSFLIGSEFFYSQFHGGSSFIPSQVNPPDFIGGYRINHSSSLNLGINGGYSHTFVIKQHFFLALGLTFGPQISYSVLTSSDENQSKEGAITWGLNGLIRAGMGYNCKKVYVGIFFFSENLIHQLSISDASSSLSAGIIKLNFVYRFTLKKPIKFLNPNYLKFLQPEKDEPQ